MKLGITVGRLLVRWQGIGAPDLPRSEDLKLRDSFFLPLKLTLQLSPPVTWTI